MSRPAVFLDRDGTIIVEQDYLSDPAGAILEDKAVAGLRLLVAAGWPLVVITNQSGIGRGYFTRADAEAVNARVAELLRAGGIEIAGWYLCPHAPGESCRCRKPLAGMAQDAAQDLDLDLTRSFVIGDKRADLGVADAIGATGLLVRTGHGAEEARFVDPALICADLLEAAQRIIGAG